MRPARAIPRLIPILLLPLLACSGDGLSGRIDAGGALERGGQRASDLIALSRRSPLLEGEEALEVLYLERHRLGLGSPFRLIDQALLDERLAPERRRRLAEALLAMAYDGAGYAVDASALPGERAAAEAGVGVAHLRLVTDAVAEASEPRVGELAVRLAYLLAQAEGLVGAPLVRGAAHAAAQVRDREAAKRDARALVREAYATRRDVVDLVSEWRAAHRFDVEAPRIEDVSFAEERLAMELAPRLTDAIRQLAAHGAASADLHHAGSTPLLNAATASGLSHTLGSMPPQSPVAVGAGLAARMFAHAYGLDPDTLTADLRRRMPDEERMAIQNAILLEHQPELRPVLARATLAAGSGLRAYGQEAVWRPGMPAPTTRELIAQFGLTDVTFAESVPAEWRPYYRRMIHSALLDLQRVLPALDVRGLRLAIGPAPSRGALALHSPGQRTIHLPPETGAGTIAHEIAHDLDWQVARKRYRVRGDYGSDIASRGGRSDRLAATYVGLTGAALVENVGTPIDRPHHSRPAEIFARSMDWLVAASLARDGRTNGYLTSIQDEVLTGYGTAVPPDPNGRVGAALVNILDEVAPMRAENRSWYLETYGLERGLSPLDLVRLIAEVPPTPPIRAGQAVEGESVAPAAVSVLGESIARLRTTRSSVIAAGVCRAASSSLDPHGTGARRAVIEAATRARARGLAREYASRVLGTAGETALVERFQPGPWATPVDESQAGLLRALVAATNEMREATPLAGRQWFAPVAGPECG